jgi:hypothetical protein
LQKAEAKGLGKFHPWFAILFKGTVQQDLFG